MPRGANAFRQFSHSFERWRWLVPPVGDLGNTDRLTYAIDLDLDHQISYLADIGRRALDGDTAPDWPNIVPEYLADLNTIERNVEAAPITAEQKKRYKTYISECRLIWEQIAQLPVPAEGRLGFRSEVLSRFRFLEDTYGFRVVESTPIRIRYESLTACIQLRHAPRSPDMGFELGSRENSKCSEVWFSLDDIAFWAGLSLQFDYTAFDLGTRQGVASFIAQAARLVRTHAEPLLLGDTAAYALAEAKQIERERLVAAKLEGGEPDV